MTERQQRQAGGSVVVAAAALMACASRLLGQRRRARRRARGRPGRRSCAGPPTPCEEAGSSKARTSMEMATGGTRVTIRGEGVYDYRERLGRLKVLLPQDPAGASEHRPITELLAPGALFMKNRGAGVPADKWVRVDTATLSDGNLVTGGATDPFAAAEVLRGTQDGDVRRARPRSRAPRCGTTGVPPTSPPRRGAPPAGNRGPWRRRRKGSPRPRCPSTSTSTTRAASARSATGSASSTDSSRAPSRSPRRRCCTTSGSPRDVRLPAPEDIYAGQDRRGVRPAVE